MTRKSTLKITLIAALFFIALGGWLLHTRIHPITTNSSHYLPFISGFISILLVPCLFWSSRTLTLAFLINGFSVIIGTIAMAHFTLTHLPASLLPKTLLLDTTLADIMLLWGKFFVGKALFDLEFFKSDQDLVQKGRFFRYPKMGWWLVHLISLATVYALGKILWK